eukprot:GEMP01032759.1.p1 GENE.GEMP01032759.1~~GEMP01032759.1.p1  ORF type:complete len:410 (-),score=77.58 GEMP01032759.1:851-2080(-)
MWAFTVPLVLGAATDLGGTPPNDEHLPVIVAEDWRPWVFEPNCTLHYYSGWIGGIEIKQNDIYNYEEVLVSILGSLRAVPQCPVSHGSFRGKFAITNSPETPDVDADAILMICEIVNTLNKVCLDEFYTVAKLHYKNDAHQWKRFYLWRRLSDDRVHQPNPDGSWPSSYIFSDWKMYKEFQIYWDPDMSIMTSDLACAKHGDVNDLRWMQNLEQKWNAKLLERKFIYHMRKEESKGVICIRYVDPPYIHPDQGFNWGANPRLGGFGLPYPDAYFVAGASSTSGAIRRLMGEEQNPANTQSGTFLAPQTDQNGPFRSSAVSDNDTECDSNHEDCQSCSPGCCIASPSVLSEAIPRRLEPACVCDPDCAAKTKAPHNHENGGSPGGGQDEKDAASQFALFTNTVVRLFSMT